jgi:membrane associated rhomboid family serine protease
LFPVKDNIRTDRVPFVTLLIGALSIAAYIWSIQDTNGTFWDGPTAGFLDQHDKMPYSLFLNTAFLPLAANLMFLWVFGNSLEDAMGAIRFACFYVLGGLVSIGVAYAIGGEPIALVGATGATAAVLGGYLLFYPHGKVLTVAPIPFFVTVVEVVAIAFLGVWIALQVILSALELTTTPGADDVAAYLGPVAGLLFGVAAVKVFAVRRSPSYATASD